VRRDEAIGCGETPGAFGPFGIGWRGNFVAGLSCREELSRQVLTQILCLAMTRDCSYRGPECRDGFFILTGQPRQPDAGDEAGDRLLAPVAPATSAVFDC
jgi:hypothetical protein